MRVTVGIPFYNSAGTLADAIRSVFAQTFQDWELLLVDDGSTDQSLAIARSVDDPRVKVISDGVNRGLSYRLNQIVGLAQGDLIARMDADDLMHPHRLQQQVEFLQAHPDVQVLGTATFTVSADLRITGWRSSTMDPSPRGVLRHALFIHPSVMARAQWYQANLYDSAYIRAEDHELWVRTSKHTQFAALPDRLLFYREGDVVNLRNYLLSARTDRKIFRMYGPEMVGFAYTGVLLGQSWLKSLAYQVFTSLGLQHHLVRRRNAPVTESDAEEARRIIQTIQAAQVPGLQH